MILGTHMADAQISEPSQQPHGIPLKGIASEEILETMSSFKEGDVDWKGGKVWSLVYHVSDEHTQLLKDAYNAFFSENYLNPMAFASLKRMESEVVAMTRSMLNGESKSVGSMTSGGTESILMAVKTYRDWAKKHKPLATRPHILVAETVHVAFEKAAQYFGVGFVKVPISADHRMDVNKLKKMINRNTILICASAPQYPQGVVDPIEEIAEVAKHKGIPLHVDSCIGGFLLPWLEQLGYSFPKFDFRIDGVTSISADIHKYGYAAKGASVLLYKSMDYMRYQFFISTEWTGGIYASPNMPGTKPGGSIAAAWAAMKSMGQEGYLNLAKEIMTVRDRYLEGLKSIPEIRVLGEPDMSLVAIASARKNGVDIYAVADQLEKKGWHVDRQQSPPSLHVTITANHAQIIDRYLEDIKESVAIVKANPELSSEGNAAMYGMMAKVPIRSVVKLSVRKIMEGMYSPDGAVPDLANLEASDGEEDDQFLKTVGKFGRILGKIKAVFK